jgi:hypothetical protein
MAEPHDGSSAAYFSASLRAFPNSNQQAGRPELIRSPKRVLAHSWEAL